MYETACSPSSNLWLHHLCDKTEPAYLSRLSSAPTLPDSAWDACSFQGHVVTGNLLHGMDLLAIGELWP